MWSRFLFRFLPANGIIKKIQITFNSCAITTIFLAGDTETIVSGWEAGSDFPESNGAG